MKGGDAKATQNESEFRQTIIDELAAYKVRDDPERWYAQNVLASARNPGDKLQQSQQPLELCKFNSIIDFRRKIKRGEKAKQGCAGQCKEARTQL